MNERIKKLAETAGFYFYDMHDVDGQDLGESIEADEWSAADKFAELIVRDVVTTVKRTQATSPDFEWAILNNYDFGVEE